MKQMPTQPLPADSFYEYVPGTDNWVIKKKSGNKILSKKDIKAYEGGWPGEEDSVTWGAAAPNTYSDEPNINHDYPLGENEPEKEGPTRAEFIKHFVENAHPEHGHIVDVSIKDRSVTFQDGQKFSFDDLTNLLPSPDRGSDNPTVNDYSQNYFWGPTDLGKAHQNQPGANGWLPAGTEDMDGPSPNSRMSSLNKKAYGVGNYWIDPNGKRYKVSDVHTRWAKRNIKNINEQFGYNLPVDIVQEGRLGSYYAEELLKLGWIRIADTMANGQFVIQLKDLNNIPSAVDDFVAEYFNPDSKVPIIVDSLKGANAFVYNPFPTLQKGIEDSKRQPTMSSFSSFMQKQSNLNKKAEYIEVDSPDSIPVRILLNPSKNEVLGALNHSETHELRYIMVGGVTFVWDAYYGTHDWILEQLLLAGYVEEGEHPELGIINNDKFVNQVFGSLNKKASLDDVLDQTTQDAIAAEYGVQYLIPLRLYSEATSYGQEKERAFRYAIEESKRMHQEIDLSKLAELIETYF